MSTEMDNQMHVNLRLAPHMGAKLDALCRHYDMDRSHMLRRLIHEEYKREFSRAEPTQDEMQLKETQTDMVADAVVISKVPVPKSPKPRKRK